MLFDAMERHIGFVDRQLASELQRIEAAMDSEIEADPAGEEGTLHAWNDTWVDAAWMMPTLQWWSTVVMGYALFERQLNEVCAFAQSRRGLELKVVDTYGNGIDRAKTYLSKVFGVKHVFSTHGWGQAKLYGALRNVIVHHAGVLPITPGHPRSLYARLSAEDGVSFREELSEDSEAAVVLDAGFVRRSTIALGALLQSVAAELGQVLDIQP